MRIVNKLKESLDSNTCARENIDEVLQPFQRLNVKVSKNVEDFLVTYFDL